MEININLDGVLLSANNLSDVASAAASRINIGAEPLIAAGVNTQYWRGDKTWQTLNTTAVSEGINLYYTQARFDTAFAAKTTTNLNEGINLYFTEDKVRDTDLAGLSITGGSIGATDTVLEAFGKLQNQIAGLLGGAIVQGVWNATTNTPALASGVGTTGYYYVVNVAGSTNLDGITDWKVGDWAIFINGAWNKVDNTDAVSSVNGYVGAVSLVKSDFGLGNVENTALSTWAGSANITTLGTIGTGTWHGSAITETYLSITDVTTGNVSNTAHGFFPKLTANSVYYVNNAGALTALTVGASGTVLTGNGVTSAPTWNAASSGITVGTTTITSGTTTNIPFNLAGVYQEANSANFDYLQFIAQTVSTGSKVRIGPSTYINTPVNGTGGVIVGDSKAMAYGDNRYVLGRGCMDGSNSIGIGQNSGNNGTLNNSIVIGSSSVINIFPARSAVIAIGHSITGLQAGNIGYWGSATYYNDILYFNDATAATPKSITLSSCGGFGTNINGADFKIQAGLPTGDGSSTAVGRNGYITLWTGDVGASGTTLRTATEKARLVQGGDLVLGITSDTKGLVLKASDGHYWRITISTLGVLSTADLGTSIPT